MTEFRFDWQMEPEGFLKWMVVALTAGQDIEDLSVATSRYTNVELTILINGIPVNAKAFIAGVERNMDYHAREEARKMIEHVDSSRLTDTVQAILDWTRDEMLRLFAEKGIDLPEEVW